MGLFSLVLLRSNAEPPICVHNAVKFPDPLVTVNSRQIGKTVGAKAETLRLRKTKGIKAKRRRQQTSKV